MSHSLTSRTPKPKYDVVLIGGGIMSATLATLLHEFDPNLEIAILKGLVGLRKKVQQPGTMQGRDIQRFVNLIILLKNRTGQ